MSVSEKSLVHLEQQIPSLSAAAVKIAYQHALASNQKVLVSGEGGLYQVFPDGSRKLVRQSKRKPLKMPAGTRVDIR